MQDQKLPSPVPEKTLPPNGTKVVAMTYPSIEYDRGAKEVTGVLATAPSPFGGLPQCWVEGIQVDPDTVRPANPALPDTDSQNASGGVPDMGGQPPV